MFQLNNDTNYFLYGTYNTSNLCSTNVICTLTAKRAVQKIRTPNKNGGKGKNDRHEIMRRVTEEEKMVSRDFECANGNGYDWLRWRRS